MSELACYPDFPLTKLEVETYTCLNDLRVIVRFYLSVCKPQWVGTNAKLNRLQRIVNSLLEHSKRPCPASLWWLEVLNLEVLQVGDLHSAFRVGQGSLQDKTRRDKDFLRAKQCVKTVVANVLPSTFDLTLIVTINSD